MRSFYLAIVCCMGMCAAYAGDITRVAATYEYVSGNPDETPAQAEAKAFEYARRKALEDKFGLDVSSVTNTLVTNRTGNGNEHSETNVFALGETSVRGEWIETVSEKVLEKNFTNGFWIIKVRVEGRARNYAFRDGNDIFLRFSSPVSGKLCVYLVDEDKNAFCLLPYPKQQNGAQSVEANKEYIFFSSDFDESAQEYTLNCERSSEQNALYVIFSPNDFTKAADKQGGKNFRDEQLPRELTYEALMKWLARNQTKDPDMAVHSTLITIRK